MAIRIIVIVSWFSATIAASVIMDAMFLDFEDIVLVAFVLLSLFLLVYIALLNHSQNKTPLLHPKNSAVCGICVLFLALFRSIEKAGSLKEETTLFFYIITTIAAFVVNMLVFSSDSYIPTDRAQERKTVENKIEREMCAQDEAKDGCEEEEQEENWFDFDAFDSDKYRIDISYSAQYFDKSQKDASIHFQNGTASGYNKKGWYYAEIENKAMRDYYFPENEDFNEFLLDLTRKNSTLIQPIYMCSYCVNGWEGVKEVCDKISSLSLAPQMQVVIYFLQDDIDDFIAKMASMRGLSENMRGYFKWQFKGDFESLEESKSVRRWGKTTFFDNSLVLKMHGKRVAVVKKTDSIRLEIL